MREKLRALMDEHHLTAHEVAKLMNRSSRTVWAWLDEDNPRQIPEHSFKLLETKLNLKKLLTG
jgi:hypothetical protein